MKNHQKLVCGCGIDEFGLPSSELEIDIFHFLKYELMQAAIFLYHETTVFLQYYLLQINDHIISDFMVIDFQFIY